MLLAALAANVPRSVMAQEEEVRQFEVDVVFPRPEEVYKAAEVFPIAIAIQNISAFDSIKEDYTFSWFIISYHRQGGVGEWNQRSGFHVDTGDFAVPEQFEKNDDSYIFVANSNVSEWILDVSSWRHGGVKAQKYMIRWAITAHFGKRCSTMSTWEANNLFMIEAPGDSDLVYFDPDTETGVVPDVTKIPSVLECPIMGPSSTSSPTRLILLAAWSEVRTNTAKETRARSRSTRMTRVTSPLGHLI